MKRPLDLFDPCPGAIPVHNICTVRLWGAPGRLHACPATRGSARSLLNNFHDGMCRLRRATGSYLLLSLAPVQGFGCGPGGRKKGREVSLHCIPSVIDLSRRLNYSSSMVSELCCRQRLVSPLSKNRTRVAANWSVDDSISPVLSAALPVVCSLCAPTPGPT